MFITPTDIREKLEEIVSSMDHSQGFGKFVFVFKKELDDVKFTFEYKNIEVVTGFKSEEEFDYSCKNIIDGVYWDMEVVKQFYILQKQSQEYKNKIEKKNKTILKKYKKL